MRDFSTEKLLTVIDPNVSAEENIQNLAFLKGGLLVEEFERIFSDLFAKRSPRYKQIVEGIGLPRLIRFAPPLKPDLRPSGDSADDAIFWRLKRGNF